MSDNSSTSFLNFKSSLSKVSFILIAIFVFIMILQISIALFAAFFNARSSLVKLTNGMNDATQMVYIPQDPSVNEAKTIYRSDNQDGGIEFTWSVWLFINDLGNPDNKYKHIFHKGNPDISENGLIYPNNSPAVLFYNHADRDCQRLFYQYLKSLITNIVYKQETPCRNRG